MQTSHIPNKVTFLLAGRPPGPEMENCIDRESYSLAAGLALGLVMFGVSVLIKTFQSFFIEDRVVAQSQDCSLSRWCL